MLPAACSSKPAPAAAEPAAPAVWGDLKPVVSVKQLMDDLIDPASDFVFNAVGTVISDKGIVETEPKSDDDWAQVRVGAVTMAEGIDLLKIPRPIAAPGGGWRDSRSGLRKLPPGVLVPGRKRPDEGGSIGG